jgi:hypothetical protein
MESIGGFEYAKLLAIDANKSHLGDADFTIDAMRFFGCDV